jgi:hypothetical protein
MSNPVTELTFIPIKPELDIETPGSEGHKIVTEINEILLNIKGLQKLTWGPQLENPRTYEWALGRVNIVFPSTATKPLLQTLTAPNRKRSSRVAPTTLLLSKKLQLLLGAR